MKRDMKLIREILLAVEDYDGWGYQQVKVVPGYSEDEVAYHVRLMIEAKLLTGKASNSSQRPTVYIGRMTWQGHDFLDAARNATLFNKVVDEAKNKGIGLTLDLLKDILSAGSRGLMAAGTNWILS